MAYSRWGFSKWYTFHHCKSGDTLDSQVFTVCEAKESGDADFTYKQLVENIEACLDECNPNNYYEREKLKGYMKEFIQAMEAQYTTWI